MATAKKAAPKKGAKKGSKNNPLTSDQLDDVLNNDGPLRNFSIVKADIKDDFCNYTFEVTDGVGIGDRHKVEGKSGTIKEELRKAIAAFNFHLAYIDCAFLNAGIEVETIHDVINHNLRDHELSELYKVTGFTLSGTENNLSVVLSGHKYSGTAFGYIDIKSTPKVQIDELSSYKLHEDLLEIVKEAQDQVARYKEGNYIPVATDEDEEDTGDATQLTIGDQIAGEKGADTGLYADMSNGEKKTPGTDSDFDNAKENE